MNRQFPKEDIGLTQQAYKKSAHCYSYIVKYWSKQQWESILIPVRLSHIKKKKSLEIANAGGIVVRKDPPTLLWECHLVQLPRKQYEDF